MDETRFNSVVSLVLSEAGWFPGRDVGHKVDNWLLRLCNQGRFKSFPSAILALREFGGIEVQQHGPGVECAREPFEIDPLVEEGYETELAHVGEIVNDGLFPFGQVGGGQAFLVIGETGSVYYMMDHIGLLGRDIDETLTRLIEGRWPLYTWDIDLTNTPASKEVREGPRRR